jgi:hypothetical protein
MEEQKIKLKELEELWGQVLKVFRIPEGLDEN